MGKVILYNMISIDGFFEGPNHDISWHNVDAEFNEFAIEQLDSASALIFGRKTYELMAGWWPMPEALQNDPIVAGWMNALPKLVFSRTLDRAGWSNTRLVRDAIIDEVSKLQSAEKNAFIFGSANLASTLRKMGLVDEYRIMVNPVVLGKGTLLFTADIGKLALRLIRSKTFKSGNVLLCYEVEKKQSIPV